ncbi:MAG: aspartate aminotransferase [Candidatus Omnitrophica bacterium CG1_02_49_10]|nr:MAG: aspartate aminotransferase [Candidatus Omnitrophica bacterium CG1_02_49_10]
MDISERLRGIKPSATLTITSKAKKMKKDGIDVISFAAGEPDFDTPDYVKEAAKKAIDSGFTKYTPASGTDELKAAICGKFERDNGLKYSTDQIVVSNGAKHSIYNALLAVCEPGDEVLMISPFWLSYPVMVEQAGGVPKVIDTDGADGYKITPEKLKRAIGPKTKVLILNSPSNPAGVIYDKDELSAIASILCENNITVISDEIYEKIIYDGRKHVSIGSLSADILGRTITIDGLSKSHAMTGWRIGYLGAPRDVAKAISSFQSHTTSNPSSISQKAAMAALSGGDAFVKGMVVEFDRRRRFMMDRLDSIKLRYIRPEGAFYIFVDISGTGLSSLDLAGRLLEEEKVAVIPGESFGMDDFVRLSFATSMRDITAGLERLEKWLSRL